MIERFLKQTHFESVEDYNKHLEFIIPENFNFAYDVMDVWAEEAPENSPSSGLTTKETRFAQHTENSKSRLTRRLHTY